MESEAEVRYDGGKNEKYLFGFFKFDGGICGKLYFKKCVLQPFRMVLSNSLEILLFWSQHILKSQTLKPV